MFTLSPIISYEIFQMILWNGEKNHFPQNIMLINIWSVFTCWVYHWLCSSRGTITMAILISKTLQVHTLTNSTRECHHVCRIQAVSFLALWKAIIYSNNDMQTLVNGKLTSTIWINKWFIFVSHGSIANLENIIIFSLKSKWLVWWFVVSFITVHVYNGQGKRMSTLKNGCSRHELPMSQWPGRECGKFNQMSLFPGKNEPIKNAF